MKTFLSHNSKCVVKKNMSVPQTSYLKILCLCFCVLMAILWHTEVSSQFESFDQIFLGRHWYKPTVVYKNVIQLE